MTIDELIATFQRHYYLPDPAPLELALGTVLSTRMDVHQPVWVFLVGPPSSGKTAIFDAFARQSDVRVVSTVTKAGLLSGTTSRTPGATGGLLMSLGTHGTLCLKDFTSILSMSSESRAEVLAAFREIYDQHYARELGGQGGRRLSWQGKIGLLAGVTEVIDLHASAMGVMGERFVYYRMPVLGHEERLALGAAAGRNAHREGEVRAELADAVDQFLTRAVLPSTVDPLPSADEWWLERLCDLVTRCRTSVARSFNDDVLLVPEPEEIPRLVGMCFSLLKGLEACGIAYAERRRLVAEVALGSIPKVRRSVLDLVMGAGRRDWTCHELGRVLRLSHKTVRLVVEELAAVRVLDADAPQFETLQSSEWLRARWSDAEVPTLHVQRRLPGVV